MKDRLPTFRFVASGFRGLQFLCADSVLSSVARLLDTFTASCVRVAFFFFFLKRCCIWFGFAIAHENKQTKKTLEVLFASGERQSGVGVFLFFFSMAGGGSLA